MNVLLNDFKITYNGLRENDANYEQVFKYNAF